MSKMGGSGAEKVKPAQKQEQAKPGSPGYSDEALRLLISKGPEAVLAISADLDKDGRSALHLAVFHAHVRLTQELLLLGAEANARDAFGRTPLHLAAAQGFADLVLELLASNADPNLFDAPPPERFTTSSPPPARTALHKAVLCDNPEVVRALAEVADLKLADSMGATAALVAAEYGRVAELSILLEQDPSLALAANNEGWTGLHLAARAAEVRRITQRPSKHERVIKLLLDVKADVNAADEDKKTALHRAVLAGNSETLSTLLEGGADVNSQDSCRWTPLHYACQEGNLGIAKALLKARAEVQRENAPCMSPLAVATMDNQVKIVELLLNHNADPRLSARGAATPMMIARQEPVKLREILDMFNLGPREGLL